ncbi:MAG: hypothetical protein COA78_27685 [Blastopirellula sp.]|nr:MAG: hypothetical protein COA78_27685 [Blastopirellula sp.]
MIHGRLLFASVGKIIAMLQFDCVNLNEQAEPIRYFFHVLLLPPRHEDTKDLNSDFLFFASWRLGVRTPFFAVSNQADELQSLRNTDESSRWYAIAYPTKFPGKPYIGFVNWTSAEFDLLENIGMIFGGEAADDCGANFDARRFLLGGKVVF